MASSEVQVYKFKFDLQPGSLTDQVAPVRFEPRTHRLRGWIIDFPSQVPRRLLEYPELADSALLPWARMTTSVNKPIYNTTLTLTRLTQLISNNKLMAPEVNVYEFEFDLQPGSLTVQVAVEHQPYRRHS